MLSTHAIEYTLRRLIAIAFPTDTPLSFAFRQNGQELELTLGECWHMRWTMLSDAERMSLLSGEAKPTMLFTADGQLRIPAFRATSSMGEAVQLEEEWQVLAIPYDLITPSFLLLARAEERPEIPRDAHGRFPYTHSLAYLYHFIDIPLVDEYALLLRKWVLYELKPNLVIHPRNYRIIPTHDIDLLYRFTNPVQAFRSIFGRDLLLYHSPTLMRTSLQEYKKWRHDALQDPYIQAIQELIEISKENRHTAIFFFKALEKGEEDATYDIHEPAVHYAVQQIIENGMNIGLHGSYHSFQSPKQLHMEKQRLETLTGTPIIHGRQHYLRYSLLMQGNATHNTLQTWQQTGIQHDYTLGYAEQPGFRCGTCHPYPLYDLDHDCETPIVEHPLIVMDGSLFDYLKLNLPESLNLVQRLQNRCQAVGGDFIILWHNHLVGRNYRQLFERGYVKIISNHQSNGMR